MSDARTDPVAMRLLELPAPAKGPEDRVDAFLVARGVARREGGRLVLTDKGTELLEDHGAYWLDAIGGYAP